MEQRTPEWKAARVGRVTASKVAAVIAKGRGNEPSLTRAKYMGQLIAETLTGQAIEGFTSAAMEWGTATEPLGCARYEVAYDLMVEHVGFVQHPTIMRSGASPDGLVYETGLVEIKCPDTHTHIEYLLAGIVPPAYVPQMAWQLACTGRKWCDFVSFDPRLPADIQLFVVRYVPAAGYLLALEAAVEAFLEEMDAKIAALRKRSFAAPLLDEVPPWDTTAPRAGVSLPSDIFA